MWDWFLSLPPVVQDILKGLVAISVLALFGATLAEGEAGTKNPLIAVLGYFLTGVIGLLGLGAITLFSILWSGFSRCFVPWSSVSLVLSVIAGALSLLFLVAYLESVSDRRSQSKVKPLTEAEKARLERSWRYRI